MGRNALTSFLFLRSWRETLAKNMLKGWHKAEKKREMNKQKEKKKERRRRKRAALAHI